VINREHLLDRPLLQVDDDRSRDPGEIHPFVLPKATIFRRDEGIGDMRREFVERNPKAALRIKGIDGPTVPIRDHHAGLWTEGPVLRKVARQAAQDVGLKPNRSPSGRAREREQDQRKHRQQTAPATRSRPQGRKTPCFLGGRSHTRLPITLDHARGCRHPLLGRLSGPPAG
jgi:hypothetical protein